MKKTILYTLLSALILLPGCAGNLIDWGKQTFVHGKRLKDTSQIARHFVRKINIYDQLNTVGLFDALWLSDQVRSFYADRYALMTGKSDEEKMVMLRRLFKANSEYISLYVLTPFDVLLSVKPVQWTVYLEIDGKKYQPTYIKACEVPIQYQCLFKDRLNPHKQPYEVKFDRYDNNESDLLSPNVPHTMTIYISSTNHVGSAQWLVGVIDPQRMLELQKQLSEKPEEESKQIPIEEVVKIESPVTPSDL